MKPEFTIEQIKKFNSTGYQSVSARMVKSIIIHIENELIALKSDERNYYKTADVFTNAPLALIQMGLTSQIHTLEKILNIPFSKFPLQNPPTE